MAVAPATVLPNWCNSSFPLATFIINILGCFFDGLAVLSDPGTPVAQSHAAYRDSHRRFGRLHDVLDFAMEALLLVGEGATRTAVVYLAASVLLGLAAAFAGAWLARGP